MIELEKNTPSTELGELIPNPFNEHYLFSVNGNVFHKISYESLVVPFFDEQMNAEETLYLVIGCDSGLMPFYLQKNGLKKGSAALFIDFEEVIELSQKNYDLSKEQRMAVCHTQNWETQAEKFNIQQYLLLNKVKIIKSFAAQYHFLNDYRVLNKELSDQINLTSWEVTRNLQNSIFIQRRLANLSENNLPALTFRDRCKGKQVLILAGGPSLDRYIPWIEEHQQHYIIFIISRIAKRILNTSIKPDFILSIDPNFENFEISKEMLKLNDNSTLIYYNHLNSQLLGQWQGEKYYLDRLYPWDSSDNVENIAANGPTVTNTSIDLALFMGASQIILFGVDLCFSPDGHTHASDSIERLSGPPVGFSGQSIKTNNGDWAETKSDFLNAAHMLEIQGEMAHEAQCQMINPSPDAASIKTIEYIPIKDISPLEVITPLKDSLLNHGAIALQPEKQREGLIKHNIRIISELNNTIKLLDTLQSMAKEGIEYNKKLFAHNNPEKDFKYKIKMDKLEKRLRKNHLSSLTDICISFGTEEFLKFIRPDSDSEWTNEEIEASGHTYYSALSSGISKFKKEVKDALLRTRCRLFEVEEDNKNCARINISIMIEQWKQDIQPNRITLVETLNPKLYQQISAQDVQFLVDYYQQLIEGDLLKTRKYNSTKEFATLEGVDAKAYELFVHENKIGLQRLINALNQRDDDDIQAIIHLVKGYIHDLNNETDLAIQEYQQADSKITLESALKQLVSHSLDQGNLEITEIGLQSLVQISPIYTLQLAELYRLSGKSQEALDTYADYLESNPSDIKAMIKLGMYYIELEILDGAEFIFKHILEHEPANEVAHTYLKKLAEK